MSHRPFLRIGSCGSRDAYGQGGSAGKVSAQVSHPAIARSESEGQSNSFVSILNRLPRAMATSLVNY